MKTYFEHLVQVYKSSGYSLKESRELKHLLLSKQKAGDPPLASNSYMVQEDWDELKKIAGDYGISLTTLITLVLEDFLMKYKRSDEFFKRAGI